MEVTITREEFYTMDDLVCTLVEKNAKSELIQFAEKEEINEGDVINHMPYNSGLFFDKIGSNEDFFLKSLENDMKFASEIFG